MTKDSLSSLRFELQMSQRAYDAGKEAARDQSAAANDFPLWCHKESWQRDFVDGFIEFREALADSQKVAA